MTERTNMLQGCTQEALLAEESRGIGTAARLTGHAGGWKKANQKLSGEKIATKCAVNARKNPTLSPKLDMAERSNSLKGNQAPVLAGKTRTDDTHEATNGTNQGPASPEPSRNIVAKKVTTNDRMKKKGKQSNAVGCGAAGMEKSRAQGKPPPKRGDVMRAILREVVEEVAAGVKKVIDTGKAFCCAPEPFDVDNFLEDLPSPTRRESTATFWDKV